MKSTKILGAILIVLFLTCSYSYAGYFDYIALASDHQQYDPSRFPYPMDSIWYNGNQYWLMQSLAGTSGSDPVYPVYLDMPIYSDNRTNPFPLNDKPDYITNTNFSAMQFYDFNGFEPPGAAWEGLTYKFFIDENANGTFDSFESYEDLNIPFNSLIKMDIPKVKISGGTYPTISWEPVLHADVYFVMFYNLTDEGFVDMDVRVYSSGPLYDTSYSPANIFEDGKEYGVWVQARETIPLSGGLFHNRSGYFTTHQAVDAEDLLESFDDWTEGGDLIGSGSGMSSVNRLNAFENMLETAQTLIEEGDIEKACRQLLAIYRKCDGKPSPNDFVSGDAAFDMSKLILHLMANIECE